MLSATFLALTALTSVDGRYLRSASVLAPAAAAGLAKGEESDTSYDCFTSEGWSSEKKAWCCQTNELLTGPLQALGLRPASLDDDYLAQDEPNNQQRKLLTFVGDSRWRASRNCVLPVLGGYGDGFEPAGAKAVRDSTRFERCRKAEETDADAMEIPAFCWDYFVGGQLIWRPPAVDFASLRSCAGGRLCIMNLISGQTFANSKEAEVYLAELRTAEHEADDAEHEADDAEHEADDAEYEADDAEHEADDAEHEADDAEHEAGDAMKKCWASGKSWFDGCNTCAPGGACTRMLCARSPGETIQPTKCIAN